MEGDFRRHAWEQKELEDVKCRFVEQEVPTFIPRPSLCVAFLRFRGKLKANASNKNVGSGEVPDEGPNNTE